jgi:hypothetical protein
MLSLQFLNGRVMKSLLISVVFAVVMLSCASMSERTVSVTEAQVQEKLNARLAVPISLLKIFDVSLSNALVKFDATTGRMQTTFDSQINNPLFNQSLVGKLAISGKLRFDAPSQSIVLDEPTIENVQLDGVDTKQADLVNALAKTLGGQMLNGLTLYQVKPEDLTIGSTQYQPKDMKITNNGLQITLSPVR